MRRMYSEQELKSLIQQVIESGQINNAKPLYWHGITLYDSSKKNTFAFHILNNSETKFNNIDSIKGWAESITGQVDISGNGVIGITVGDVLTYYPLLTIRKMENNTYRFIYSASSGYETITGINLSDYFSFTIADAVNKLN